MAGGVGLPFGAGLMVKAANSGPFFVEIAENQRELDVFPVFGIPTLGTPAGANGGCPSVGWRDCRVLELGDRSGLVFLQCCGQQHVAQRPQRP